MLATLALVGIAGGCASWTVRSETSPGAQLAHYQTYAWTAPSGDPLLDQRVRDGVAAKLAAKGIHPAAPGQAPDFFVAYREQSGPRVQTVVNDAVPWAPSASGGVATPPLPSATYVYTEQSLILDFVDARSGRVFWRGYASYVVDRPPAVSGEKAQQAVGRILRRYPAPQVAAVPRPAG
jgi:hypothetical protein